MNIFSPEPFETYLLSNSGNNGDILRTIAFRRNNRASSVYLNVTLVGRVKITLFRAYKDTDNNLIYHSNEYGIIKDVTNEELILKYDMLNDHKFVTYKLEFECIDNNTTLTINNLGLIFDEIDATLNNTSQFTTNLLKDINGTPLTKQNYNESLAFTMLVNRARLDEILNVVEQPYYLVDVKDECIDNSSPLLVESGIDIQYATSATKDAYITVKNIVGNV